jgi:LysM repeat protein
MLSRIVQATAITLAAAALIVGLAAAGQVGLEKRAAYFITPPPTATALPTLTPFVFAQLPTAAPPAATLEVAPPTATPSPAAPATHAVQRGETLYRIALRYGVSVDSLMAINQIVDPRRVQVGQTLILPAPPASSPTAGLASPVDLSAAQPPPGPPTTVNGIPFESFVVMSDDVARRVREIYSTGQTTGNNPRAFSKLGDSTIENPYFLARFDEPGRYNLGDWSQLQPVLDYYAGSFGRESLAVMRGLRAAAALDPLWANRSSCFATESPLACELRVQRPSLIFIRLGSNEGSSESFDKYLRQVVELCIAQGVVPILGTKADRREGSDNAHNNAIRQIAADYAVPLWDFDLVAQTIPGRGLGNDGVHLTSFYTHDYTQPEALARGYGVHNLTALIALDEVWRVLAGDAVSGR